MPHPPPEFKNSSYYQTTVCLVDWWLINADKDSGGKRLAVAGYTSKEIRGRRLFNSAPIVKRYDTFNLETADDICIVIKGLINESLTNDNGFSSEVSSRFLLGFPPDWEAYAEKCSGMTNSRSGREGNKETAKKPETEEPASLDIRSAESGESPVPKDSDADDLCPSNLDPAVSMRNSDVDLCITPSSPKSSQKQDQDVKMRDGVNCENKNCTTVSLTNDSEAMVRCIGEKSSGEANHQCDLETAVSEKERNTKEVGSSRKKANQKRIGVVSSRSSRKGKKEKVRKPKTQGSASLERITIRSAETGESPVPNGNCSEVDDHCPSNLDPVVSKGNSDVDLSIAPSSPKSSQKLDQDVKMRDRLNCENKNCPAVSSTQDSEAIVSCIGEKSSGEANHQCDLETAVSEKERNAKQVGSSRKKANHQCDLKAAISEKERNPKEVGSSRKKAKQKRIGMVNSRSSRKDKKVTKTQESASLERIAIRNAESGGSPVPNGDGSDVDNLTPSNLEPAASMVDSGVDLSSSPIYSKKQNQNVKIKDGLNCKNKKDSIVSVSQDSESIIRCTVAKSSGDANRQCDLKTAVTNTEMNAKEVGPSKKKARRKINFEATPLSQERKEKRYIVSPASSNLKRSRSSIASPLSQGRREKASIVPPASSNHKLSVASPLSQGRREKASIVPPASSNHKLSVATPLSHKRKEELSIVSPESLNLKKRSRSGRLLLPSLDFWRNQMAVYDADRQVCGIQEIFDLEEPSKGSQSEPPKRRQRK